jgi:ATP-dependent RNA helicase DeaD
MDSTLMNNFSDLNLSDELTRAIAELGYTAPTPIQAETLPLLLGADTDFLGLAATGTGKTAAFAIPLLERIDRNTRGVQALVLCPTRELAIQVAGQIDLLGKYIGIKPLAVYGGTGYREQIDGLRNGANIIVGTPGRVVDHIEKGTLRLDGLKTLVLDEADEMISMGFQEDLETVLKAAPKDQANIWLFSATMGHDVKHVADAYLTDPKKVQINRTEMLPDTVEQIYYKIHEYDKPDLLCKVIDVADDFYGIVFCQTKALVADVNTFLVGKGYRVDCLHGDLDRKISVLIATDVACRGLDVKDVTHVVNYSLPRELDNYVHRIGRTARSGKTGIAISFVTFSHRELVGKIERMTKSRMKEGVLPTQKDIAGKRVQKVRAAFETQGPQGRATASIPEEWKTALAGMTQEDIVGRFLNLMMPDLFVKQEKPQGKVLAGNGAPLRGDSRPGSQPAQTDHQVRPEKTQGGKRYGGGEKPRFGGGKRFGDKPAYGEKPRAFGDKPRFGGPKRFGDKPAYGDRPSFGGGGKPFGNKKPFSARKESDGRTPPWERKGFQEENRERGPAKSRWKNNFGSRSSAQETDSVAAAIERDSQLPAAGGGGGSFIAGGDGKLKKKKKPYGHWKPKKDGAHNA